MLSEKKKKTWLQYLLFLLFKYLQAAMLAGSARNTKSLRKGKR